MRIPNVNCYSGNESIDFSLIFFKQGFLSQSHNLPTPFHSGALPVSREHDLLCLLDNGALYFLKHVTTWYFDCERMTINFKYSFVGLPHVHRQYTVQLTIISCLQAPQDYQLVYSQYGLA